MPASPTHSNGQLILGPPTKRDLLQAAIVRRYQLDLERVELRPNHPVWQFSSSSVNLIPQLFKLVGESAFERRLPDALVSWTLLDTSLWRWLALVLLGAVLTALSSVLSRGVLLLAHPLLHRASAYLHTELLEALAGPLRLLVAVAGFRVGMEFIDPSALLRLYLDRALAFLFSIGVAWAAMRLIDVATPPCWPELESAAWPLRWPLRKLLKTSSVAWPLSAIARSWLAIYADSEIGLAPWKR